MTLGPLVLVELAERSEEVVALGLCIHSSAKEPLAMCEASAFEFTLLIPRYRLQVRGPLTSSSRPQFKQVLPRLTIMTIMIIMAMDLSIVRRQQRTTTETPPLVAARHYKLAV